MRSIRIISTIKFIFKEMKYIYICFIKPKINKILDELEERAGIK